LNFLEFIVQHRQETLQLVIQHVALVGISMALAVVMGIPLGILATRRARLGRWVLAGANIIQTVPSLALFGFLVPVPVIGGIGSTTAIVALTLYALLPIVRNTYVGITGVDRSIVEAARGMGMTDGQLLRRVEIPLALSVILAGVRVATVISVGIATIAAAIGAGGLGVYIFRGLAMVNNQVILAGAVPAALLALAADWGLGWAERRLAVR
jgi:osmoprotectant transport system permease protein